MNLLLKIQVLLCVVGDCLIPVAVYYCILRGSLSYATLVWLPLAVLANYFVIRNLRRRKQDE